VSVENLPALTELRGQFLVERIGSLLTFWITHAQCEKFGGIYREVRNNLQLDTEVSKLLILCFRNYRSC
jgi:hypothetical protein